MNIVFLGTPEFAVPSLARIIQSKHRVVAVVTGVDKPIGRGQKLAPTPVKKYALEQQLPVLTPTRLKDEKLIGDLKLLQADLFVVVAFRILPVELFTIPPYGTINLHGSLLPKYRGAAPINWAIINGETETGVTTFFIEERVDVGDLILQRSMSIGLEETAGDVHDRMCQIGAELLIETIDLIDQGSVVRQKQQGEISLAPKITKETCRIDWSKDAVSIHNLVRGLSPFPRATTTYKGQELKICCVKTEDNVMFADTTPGKIITVDHKEKLLVATGSGVVSVLELQPECKRRMTAGEYLRGHCLEIGEVFI